MPTLSRDSERGFVNSTVIEAVENASSGRLITIGDRRSPLKCGQPSPPELNFQNFRAAYSSPKTLTFSSARPIQPTGRSIFACPPYGQPVGHPGARFSLSQHISAVRCPKMCRVPAATRPFGFIYVRYEQIEAFLAVVLQLGGFFQPKTA